MVPSWLVLQPMTAETLPERYERLLAGPNDISEHLPILRSLAEQCRHVTEFGVRDGNSTTAFLMARPAVLVSVDLIGPPALWSICPEGTDWRFVQADTKQIDIAPTDLLFLDTEHTYWQAFFELVWHSKQVRQFIVLHDTETFGEFGEDGGPGLNQAIEYFLAIDYFHGIGWRVRERCTRQNGLTILERQP